MKNKLCIIVLIMVMILSVLSISVQALSLTVSMTPNQTRVEDASELTVTVKVSNLDVGSNGINGLTASLAYDTDVFEAINESNLEGLNNWVIKYDTTGKVTASKNSFVNKEEEVFQITLKTKSGVEEGKTGTVSLSNIVATNSDEEIDATRVSTTITIGSQQTTITPPTSNTNNNASGTNAIQITPGNNSNRAENNTVNNVANNASNNAVSNYSSNVDNSNQNMPYTGPEGSGFVKIILGIALIAIVIYIKIEKLKEIR